MISVVILDLLSSSRMTYSSATWSSAPAPSSSRRGRSSTIWSQCCQTFFLRHWWGGLISLPLGTLCSQVLKFEARPEQTQLEELSDASFLGKLVLPANVGLDWKWLPGTNSLAYFGLVISNKEKKFYNIDIWSQCCQTFSLPLWTPAKWASVSSGQALSIIWQVPRS